MENVKLCNETVKDAEKFIENLKILFSYSDEKKVEIINNEETDDIVKRLFAYDPNPAVRLYLANKKIALDILVFDQDKYVQMTAIENL